MSDYDEGYRAGLQKMREVGQTRIEELEAKIATYEQRDGMDGAVVAAIRDLLNHHQVPKAAFIDDHVANAIVQRNIAEHAVKQIAEQTKGVTPDPDNLQMTIGSIHSYALMMLAEIKGGNGE